LDGEQLEAIGAALRSIVREEAAGLHEKLDGLTTDMENVKRRLGRIENTVNGIAVTVLDDEVSRKVKFGTA
jgi:hypothetical protein